MCPGNNISLVFSPRPFSLLCSSHRSIFSRESMPSPSDSATHRPISEQSALILSTSQELFLQSLFGSRDCQRAPGQQRRKTSLSSSPGDIPAEKIFTEDTRLLSTSNTNEPTLWPVTRTTCYSDTPSTN